MIADLLALATGLLALGISAPMLRTAMSESGAGRLARFAVVVVLWALAAERGLAVLPWKMAPLLGDGVLLCALALGAWLWLCAVRMRALQPSPAELAAANERLEREVLLREGAERHLRYALDEVRRSAVEQEQFAYVASHDLQTPLRNVAGFAQLLERQAGDKLDASGKEFLTYIVDGVRQMQQLINDLLKLSRVGRAGASMQERPLQETLDRACAALAEPMESAGARVVVDGVLPSVVADHELMQQLLINLLGNAIKFRRAEIPPQVQLLCRRERDDWHLELQDNGIGVPPEQLESIFTVFRRLHAADEYPGTGIGLAICRKIASYHGGQIWAASDANGTTFHLRWPCHPAVTTPRPQSP